MWAEGWGEGCREWGRVVGEDGMRGEDGINNVGK